LDGAGAGAPTRAIFPMRAIVPGTSGPGPGCHAARARSGTLEVVRSYEARDRFGGQLPAAHAAVGCRSVSNLQLNISATQQFDETVLFRAVSAFQQVTDLPLRRPAL
jgi:hypothetical protein